MNKTILLTGLFFGITAIILGAFGAHGLKRVLAPESLNSFETGVKYQMYHALFLILLSMMTVLSDSAKQTVYYFIVSGVVLFSFSIYLLATTKLTGVDFKKIGFVTPVGGLLLIVGWAALFLNVWKK